LKNNSIILILIFFTLFSCNKNQKSNSEQLSDSLAIYLQRAKDPALPDQAMNNSRALEILVLKRNDSINRQNLFEIANNYFSLEKLDDFHKTNKIVLKRAFESHDTVSIAKAYRYQAEYYKTINRNDSAFYLFLNAEKLYLKLNDKINLGKIFYKKGIIQFDIGDYFAADLSMTQAYNLLKNSDDKQFVYQTLSMIGIIANSLEDYDKAIEYHTKALDIVHEYDLNENYNQEISTLNNIGGVYQNLNNNKEAVLNFNKALNSKNLDKSSELYATLLDNLAYSKLKLKDYTKLPYLFNQSLHIRDSLKLQSAIIQSKIHLSEYYAERKDTILSRQNSWEALSLAQKIKSPIDILISLKQTSAVDHERASIYSKQYIKINDSLQQAERKSQTKFARIQLETDEIRDENDKLNQQNRNLLYFFVGTLMIGLLLFVIRTQRAKNRELLLKQAQQKANEDIYSLMITQQNKIEEGRIAEKKRIAQELHDGVLGRLFGTRLNLDSLNKMNDENSVSKRNNYLTELKNIEQDIREISHDLNREKYVLINNFVAILNNLLEEQKASFEAEVFVSIDENIKWESLSNTLKINLYRIIQEALQNINKYAQAKTIKLELKKTTDSLVVNIIDDGVGFAVNGKKKGIGLQNMLSRANDLEGVFDIRSKKGKGTTISVTFPIGNKQTIQVQ